MKKGMNPEAVEQMANQITESADTVNQIFTSTADQVEGLDWTGEDRDQYISRFSDELGQLIQQVIQAAQELAERAQQNAAAQRDTSSN